MANLEHLWILKHGVKVWNKWREDNPEIIPNLIEGDFSKQNLKGINFSKADLTEATLVKANLREANFSGAELYAANFVGANLTKATLAQAHLTEAYLESAILRDTHLASTNFLMADLSGADLTNAVLDDTNFSSANLSSANLSYTHIEVVHFVDTILNSTNFEGSLCMFTTFINVDLSTAKGLNTITHAAASNIGVDTLFLSKGKIPETFLRGCGVPETLITYLPSMMEEAIQFYSCFISYSHTDKPFARLLYDRLQGQGIRCWLDEHQLNPGDKLHETIYLGIRVYDKVILCCSESSLTSWWVGKEFERVIAKEKEFTEPLLIPVALDNYLFDQSADEFIIGEIRNNRLVQDFKNWKDHDTFEAAFAKVVKALRTDGGKPPPPPSKLTPRK